MSDAKESTHKYFELYKETMRLAKEKGVGSTEFQSKLHQLNRHRLKTLLGDDDE